MLDKATVLTTIFTIVDDTMKESAVIQQALHRPGPGPRLSDSEVITLALYQELISEPREDHFFRVHQESLRVFFPDLDERSRYNRRKRDLWSVILAARVSLHLVLDALAWEETAVIDSAPVPCLGYKREPCNPVTFWALLTTEFAAARPSNTSGAKCIAWSASLGSS